MTSDTHPRELKLTDFVDREILQSLQDGFAALTGISTSIRGPAGDPITRQAGESPFCRLMRSTVSGDEACRISHGDAALLVQAIDMPCRHECHAGLAQFVAPIVVQGFHLGTIIVGDRPPTRLRKSQVTRLAREHGLDGEELSQAAADLESWSDEEMSKAMAFVQQLANTIAQLCFQSHEMARRVDELAIIYDVSSMLAGKVELQEILDTVVQHLVTSLGIRAAGVRLLDEETGDLKFTAGVNLSTAYLDKGPVRLAESEVDRIALEGESVYVADVQTDPRWLHHDMARAEGLVSALVTGLIFRGRRIGVMRVYTDHPHEFSPFDVSLVEAVASQVATAIVNARLSRDAREKRELQRQLKLAAEVQQRMIPSKAPDSARYQFGAIYQPSAALAGDFYDFIEFDNGDLGVVIADVVGHGVAASLMMASTRSALRSNARRVSNVSDIMSFVNGRICHDTLPHEFCTMFYMELKADGRGLKYSNAGHEPLLVLRRGEIRPLDVGGMALGIDENEKYPFAEESLEPGDVLALLTDGVFEARNYDDLAYGRRRVHESLKRHAAAPNVTADHIAKQILWDVRRFVGLAPQADDITIVVVQVA